MVFFIIGSFNFALHYAVITSKKRELIKNIETQSFLITVLVLTILTTVGLMKLNIYPDFMAVFRKGFYQLISGHTTTGFMTVYAKQFYTDWGELALVAITISMLIGGSACSTAGGFKGLRVGIIVKSFFKEIKRMILPESMVVVRKFHHVKDVILEDSIVKSAMLIVILYIITFLLGTLSGMLCGYSFAESAFESASVTGNVGLSIGLTQAGMPSFLKIVYIVIMWLARLEFVCVFALAASIFVGVKKRCAR
jgi:trk system potassium uptake protein TrkH